MANQQQEAPRWYLESEDGPHQYSHRSAKLIEVYDGERLVPALLLSVQLADQIQNAIRSGRSVRRFKDLTSQEHRRLHKRKRSEIAYLQTADFRLDLLKDQMN